MGFFNMLFCCFSRRHRLYEETCFEPSYVPSGQLIKETLRTVDEPTKESVYNTTELLEITPPPEYSRNTLSEVRTVVSSEPLEAYSPKVKKEQDGVKARIIKPLPRRRTELMTSSQRLGAKVPSTPDVSLEQKTIPEQQHKSLQEEKRSLAKVIDTIPTPSTPNEPFVFVAAKSTLDETPQRRFPPSTAVYGLSSTTLPCTDTRTDFPTPTTTQATRPKKHITATTTTTGPAPGTNCPRCHSLNIPYRTAAQNLNHGRPYRKCSNSSCGSWNGFADDRGLTSGMYCECSPPSLLRLVAKNKTDSRGRRQAFYSCQYKACRAWADYEDEDGQAKWFTEGEIQRLKRKRGI